MQILDKVQAYVQSIGGNFPADAVIMASIYILRVGITYQGNILIPMDPLLSREGVLPLLYELKNYGYKNHDQTQGEGLIMDAYSQFMLNSSHLSRTELVINVQPPPTEEDQQTIHFYKPTEKRLRKF